MIRPQSRKLWIKKHCLGKISTNL